MDAKEQIKNKLNILDVVSSYVKLTPSGKTYKGKSPFTNEKTPSFFVSPEKGFFYCFSSQKGGDIFTFIQEIERIEFKDALKLLAERAGISLKPRTEEDIKKQDEKERLYKLLDTATKYFEVNLRKNKEVVEYLKERGLTTETMKQFRLGYALGEWQGCYDTLKQRGYTDQEIHQAGLVIKKDTGGYYDRFRDRVMFPIMDAQGRVVGYSGRILKEDSEKPAAKYINSPEGVLYDKSNILYGYDKAKSAISKEGSVILVEGQFDVVMAHQAGYQNTVAISGTGLTEKHIDILKRFAKTLVFALDSDNAGIKATRRSVIMALEHGLSTQVIPLPGGEDPADVIKRSKEKWGVYVHDATNYIKYRLSLAEEQQLDAHSRTEIVHTDVFLLVEALPSAIEQDRSLQLIAQFLGVSYEAVVEDFKRFQKNPQIENLKVSHSMSESHEDEFSQQPTTTTHEKQIELIALYAYLINESFPVPKEVTERYERIYGSDIAQDYEDLPEDAKNIQSFVIETQYDGQSTQQIFEIFQSGVATMRRAQIHLESEALLTKIRHAELEGDAQKIEQLTKEHHELLTEKHALMRNTN
tara:strand:- start:5095 stop:6843 length:1749 start_codon:yes stop_codon:yes gene_type:complete